MRRTTRPVYPGARPSTAPHGGASAYKTKDAEDEWLLQQQNRRPQRLMRVANAYRVDRLGLTEVERIIHDTCTDEMQQRAMRRAQRTARNLKRNQDRPPKKKVGRQRRNSKGLSINVKTIHSKVPDDYLFHQDRRPSQQAALEINLPDTASHTLRESLHVKAKRGEILEIREACAAVKIQEIVRQRQSRLRSRELLDLRNEKKALNMQVMGLQNELNATHADMEEAQKQARKKSGSYDLQRQRADKLEKERDQLVQDEKKQSQIFESVRNALVALQTHATELERKQVEDKATNARLEEELAQRSTAANSADAGISKLNDQLSEIAAERDELKNQLKLETSNTSYAQDALNTAKIELKKAISDAERSRKDVVSQTEQLAENRRQVEDMQTQLADTRAQANESRTQKNDDLAKLRSELETARAEARDARVTQIKTKPQVQSVRAPVDGDTGLVPNVIVETTPPVTLVGGSNKELKSETAVPIIFVESDGESDEAALLAQEEQNIQQLRKEEAERLQAQQQRQKQQQQQQAQALAQEQELAQEHVLVLAHEKQLKAQEQALAAQAQALLAQEQAIAAREKALAQEQKQAFVAQEQALALAYEQALTQEKALEQEQALAQEKALTHAQALVEEQALAHEQALAAHEQAMAEAQTLARAQEQALAEEQSLSTQNEALAQQKQALTEEKLTRQQLLAQEQTLALAQVRAQAQAHANAHAEEQARTQQALQALQAQKSQQAQQIQQQAQEQEQEQKQQQQQAVFEDSAGREWGVPTSSTTKISTPNELEAALLLTQHVAEWTRCWDPISKSWYFYNETSNESTSIEPASFSKHAKLFSRIDAANRIQATYRGMATRSFLRKQLGRIKSMRVVKLSRKMTNKYRATDSEIPWVQVMDTLHKVAYYYNSKTGETTWDEPADGMYVPVEDQIEEDEEGEDENLIAGLAGGDSEEGVVHSKSIVIDSGPVVDIFDADELDISFDEILDQQHPQQDQIQEQEMLQQQQQQQEQQQEQQQQGLVISNDSDSMEAASRVTTQAWEEEESKMHFVSGENASLEQDAAVITLQAVFRGIKTRAEMAAGVVDVVVVPTDVDKILPLREQWATTTQPRIAIDTEENNNNNEGSSGSTDTNNLMPMSPNSRRLNLKRDVSLTISVKDNVSEPSENEEEEQQQDLEFSAESPSDGEAMAPFVNLGGEEEEEHQETTTTTVTAADEGTVAAIWNKLHERAAPSGRRVGEWEELVDPMSEEVYFHNVITEESTWEPPAGFERRAGNDTNFEELKQSWQQLATPSGKTLYWYNWGSGESRWDSPPETITEEGKQVAEKEPPQRGVVPSTPKSKHPMQAQRMWRVMRDSSQAKLTFGDWVKMKEENSGEEYFMNRVTGEQQWEKPGGWNDELAEPTVEETVEDIDAELKPSPHLRMLANARTKAKRWKNGADSRIKNRNWSSIVSPGGRCLFEYNWTTAEVRKSLNFTANQVKEERRHVLEPTAKPKMLMAGKEVDDGMLGMVHLWKVLEARAARVGQIIGENHDPSTINWVEMLDERTASTFYHRPNTTDWCWNKPAMLANIPSQRMGSMAGNLAVSADSKLFEKEEIQPVLESSSGSGSSRLSGRRRSSSSSGGSWKKIQSLEDGVSYWFNQVTGESQWEDPAGGAASGAPSGASSGDNADVSNNNVASIQQRTKKLSSDKVQFEMNHNAIMSPKGKKLFDFGDDVV